MLFAQLTNSESLRDIETCLRATGKKLYRADIRSRVSRSTLADADKGYYSEENIRLLKDIKVKHIGIAKIVSLSKQE